MNPAGDEDRGVDVVGARVRGIVVERPPLLVQRPERGRVLRERPVAALDAVPGLLGTDLDEDRQGSIAQGLSDLVRPDGPSAEGDHGRARRVERLAGELRLAQTKRCLAPGFEDLRDRLLTLDLPVDIHERTAELLRERAAERRLARPHEADQGDVTV